MNRHSRGLLFSLHEQKLLFLEIPFIVLICKLFEKNEHKQKRGMEFLKTLKIDEQSSKFQINKYKDKSEFYIILLVNYSLM